VSKKYIVYSCVQSPAGGVADRIKGIVSCFALSKILDRQFIIDWRHPYKLQDLVLPNLYNWLPRTIQGSVQNIFAIDNDNFKIFEKYLSKEVFNHNYTADIVVIQTNIDFLRKLEQAYEFHLLFEELFKPNFDINAAKPIGLCARFGGSLSNWNDSNFDREVSYEFVHEQLMRQINQEEIFVCSDSEPFFQFLTDKKIKFSKVPGIAENIDRKCSMDGHSKAIMDFFTLRACDKILGLKQKGEFALTAAKSTGKNCIEL